MKHAHNTTTNPKHQSLLYPNSWGSGAKEACFCVHGPLAGARPLLLPHGFCSAEACLYLLSSLIVLDLVFKLKKKINFIPSLFLFYSSSQCAKSVCIRMECKHRVMYVRTK